MNKFENLRENPAQIPRAKDIYICFVRYMRANLRAPQFYSDKKIDKFHNLGEQW